MSWHRAGANHRCGHLRVAEVGFGSNKRFLAYSGGRYLGARDTLEAAQALAELRPEEVTRAHPTR